ncbi:hypothetical protein VTN49DRAFT_2095 [Thermomyces lanuginosus]|uniref:uncharacterized protein n=1 Tax=Thermomyces lanuginosus TaxID=5541 RepID=UPI003742C1EA
MTLANAPKIATHLKGQRKRLRQGTVVRSSSVTHQRAINKSCARVVNHEVVRLGQHQNKSKHKRTQNADRKSIHSTN